jgi:hypothetical protein
VLPQFLSLAPPPSLKQPNPLHLSLARPGVAGPRSLSPLLPTSSPPPPGVATTVAQRRGKALWRRSDVRVSTTAVVRRPCIRHDCCGGGVAARSARRSDGLCQPFNSIFFITNQRAVFSVMILQPSKHVHSFLL